jgi:AAA+ superfamily predicted ATPase
MTHLNISDGRCQFCHRTAGDVPKLVSGDSAFICSDCIEACHALLRPGAGEAAAESPAERYLFQRLVRHFAPLRPQELTAICRTYPLRQQADLQKALDDLFGERRVPENFVGVHQQYRHEVLSFAKLLEQGRNAVEAAPAEYEDVSIGRGETVRCLKNGLWLIREEAGKYAVLVTQQNEYGRSGDMTVEILVVPGEQGIALCTHAFAALELRLSKGSCYRGRVLSLEQQDQYSGHAPRVFVHELGAVARDDVILPELTLAAVDRNVLKFAEQREDLRKMGMSTQKGLLFHGAPGTGKTHCIRYLAGRLPDHTTLLITAEGAGLLPQYMALARLLQPALVVIEDADLMARARDERADACDEVLLNRLLNEMDGLRERADVFFIVTTNRPETLEPALAGRPGRIDQTIEFPLPNLDLRKRLISLYGKTLRLPQPLIDQLAIRTDGASPAFIKELLRRVAQHHLESAGTGDVASATAEAALHEMLFSGGELNTRLLGGAVPESA